MDNRKIGGLIRRLRKEKGMTQLQLAEKLHISDKTVSKWERGMGCPEVSLFGELSRVFAVDAENLLAGELQRNELLSGNIRNMRFFVCPVCGNLITSMTDMEIVCCGRKLKAAVPVKAAEADKLTVEVVENDYYISSRHGMAKDHYISFVAFLAADTMLLKKQYPEWDLQVRFPVFAHGRLFWYCTKHGLFYQVI